jgi:hypothetical protein
MISANTDEVSKSLEVYKAEVERKLKAMVAAFAREIAETASSSTHKNENPEKFMNLYKARAEVHAGMPLTAGFHKGAWTYTEGTLVFNPTLYDESNVPDKVEYLAQTKYNIGDSFVIGAVGTAYEMLQTRDDIEGNTLSTVRTAYMVNLPRYYNEG